MLKTIVLIISLSLFSQVALSQALADAASTQPEELATAQPQWSPVTNEGAAILVAEKNISLFRRSKVDQIKLNDDNSITLGYSIRGGATCSVNVKMEKNSDGLSRNTITEGFCYQ